ncbi:MAG TPA: ABC transporter substrate-binding protein [Gaiellaceae bacterium]|nr:ABC transporter substrate-binding protein [Gaiellaceae bacterium]
MRAALALGAAFLLVAATACGERKEPTGPLAESYPVTVQGGGDRPTVVDAAPRRIVPVGAGPRQILRSLGLGRRIVTVNDTLVGLPLVDAIRRAKPDLIVASSGTDPLDLARARAATKAEVYVEPSSSLDDVVQAIGEIGLIAGEPVRARRLTAAIESRRREVTAKLAGAKVVSVFVDDGDFSTISSRSLLGDLITEARGRNVAGASPEQGPFPLARLLRLDPDLYLATAASGRTLRQLRSRPGTRRLRAVREGRFAVLPPEVGVAGPGVGAALAEVARILHP